MIKPLSKKNMHNIYLITSEVLVGAAAEVINLHLRTITNANCCFISKVDLLNIKLK